MDILKFYPLYHALCGEVAFFTTRLLISGIDNMIPSEFYFKDGTQPLDGHEIICGHCHNSTMDGYFGEPFVYKSAQPVEVMVKT
jgi:hypothetical protein